MKPWTLLVPALMTLVVAGCASSQTQAACATAADRSSSDGLDKLTSEQLALKMMELTGSAKLGLQMMASMGDSLRKMPGMPPGFTERFQQNARPEDLTNLLVPIYVRNYDRDTMIAAIHFYQSDSGRTLIAHLPDVTRESTEAGKVWGRTLAQKTLKEMGQPTAP